MSSRAIPRMLVRLPGISLSPRTAAYPLVPSSLAHTTPPAPRNKLPLAAFASHVRLEAHTALTGAVARNAPSQLFLRKTKLLNQNELRWNDGVCSLAEMPNW